ncbi:MAG: A24 family peptidase [Candidatus Micrarchaeota archaeon]
MWEFALLLFIALVFYFDLKSRIIPDPINFFFMFLAIALTIFQYRFDIDFLLSQFAPFFLLNFAFAYFLYRLGVWAGGDVKFFTAIMAFMPLYGDFRMLAAIPVFLLSAFLLIPITLLYHLDDLLLLRRDFHRIFVNSIVSAGRGTVLSFSALFIISRFSEAYSSPLLVIFFILLSFLIRIPFKFALPLMLLGLLFFRLNDYLSLLLFLFFAGLVLHLMQRSFSMIFKRILTKPVLVSKLRIGDIPAETYFLRRKKLETWSAKDALRHAAALIEKGKALSFEAAMDALKPKGTIIADSLKAAGVSLSEIKELKRLRVKQILVKESLPFAPVIAAAFLLYKYLDILVILGIAR